MHLSEACGPLRSLDRELRWLAEQGSMEILIPGQGRLQSEFGEFARVRSLDYTAMMVPRGPVGWLRVLRGHAKQVIRDAAPNLIVITSVVLPTALLAARLEGIPTAAIIACTDRVGRQYASRKGKVTRVNPSIGRRYARGNGERFRREHRIPNGPFIVAVGALTHGRGQDVLVRALPRIQNTHPDARLAIVGAAHPREVDREFEQALIGLAEGLAPDNITFTGFEERVEDAYAAADVLVNPAPYEAFGRVAFEGDRRRTAGCIHNGGWDLGGASRWRGRSPRAT